MQGKIQDCKSAFVVDEKGNDIKISDRDEVNDLKSREWITLAKDYETLILMHENDNYTIDLIIFKYDFNRYTSYRLPNGYKATVGQISGNFFSSDFHGQKAEIVFDDEQTFHCMFYGIGGYFTQISASKTN